MPIDVHAHYVPPRTVERLRTEGARLGIDVVDQPNVCPCLRFKYGLAVRPFFPRLLEAPSARIEKMQATGIDRQVLSGWVDVFGYGLDTEKGAAWHRLMNDMLAETCGQHPDRFSFLASGHLPDAGAAARELERAVREDGAIGGVVACNVEGTNLGELPLDEYWATAAALDVPVFLHPTQPQPVPRSRKFALNQVVQYTFDTTLALGTLIWSGVLDRHPKLRLLVSHGGGALPFLIGRFDCMHGRGDRAHTGIASEAAPSAYLRRMHYDTILHDAEALRYLATKVGTDRIVLGTDDSFPPADPDPLRSVRAAGFDAATVTQIADANPRELFPALAQR